MSLPYEIGLCQKFIHNFLNNFAQWKTDCETDVGKYIISADVKITYFRQMKECLFQEVLGAANVLGDGVSGVVTTTEPCPLLGTQASAVVASTRISPCRARDRVCKIIIIIIIMMMMMMMMMPFNGCMFNIIRAEAQQVRLQTFGKHILLQRWIADREWQTVADVRAAVIVKRSTSEIWPGNVQHMDVSWSRPSRSTATGLTSVIGKV